MSKFKIRGRVGLEREDIFGVGVEYVTSIHARNVYTTESGSIIEVEKGITFKNIFDSYIKENLLVVDYFKINFAFKDADVEWTQEYIDANITSIEVEYINLEYVLGGLSVIENLTLDDDDYNLKDIFISKLDKDFLLSIEPVI